tara:strand:+ start:1366 stop:1650 length:285 start_codon:yes stop_codon:yes gene_type:complete
MRGRRNPNAFGTQQEPDEFKKNVKKNNNGTNGNGTGNKSTSNVNTPTLQEPSSSNKSNTSAGSNGAVNRNGKDPFKGIKPGMTKDKIKEVLKIK